ncbi:MAG: hypothetical protein NZ899_10555 [Thermoguttaceae bacterium]|nr:hypothetical protein [Thermoguttaceae bacterium]
MEATAEWQPSGSAEGLLHRLEGEPALAQWCRERAEFINGVKAVIAAGRREEEAEKLYAEAKKLLQAEELFELRDLVHKLSSEYADTLLVVDYSRQPTFAHMVETTLKLGRKIVVRQDGKGDFTRIQPAVDAAQVGDLIEIQDNGPYSEAVTFSESKSDIILSGAKNCWPLLISVEPNSVVGNLLTVRGANITIKRLLIINQGAYGRTPMAVNGTPKLSTVLVVGQISQWRADRVILESCVLLGMSGGTDRS